MMEVYIRCDECKQLYLGDLEDTVEVYEIDATPMGAREPVKLPSVRKHLCGPCKEQALRR